MQPPSLLVHLGKYLAQAGAWEASVEVLRKAQGRYPNDFWVNYALAMSLVEQKPSRPDEAVGFARVARALRPQSRLAQFLLGRELAALGQMTEAQVYLRRADELKGLQEPPCYLMLSAQAVQEVERGDFAPRRQLPEGGPRLGPGAGPGPPATGRVAGCGRADGRAGEETTGRAPR